MKNVIVTGATSMIGVAVIEQLLIRDTEKIYAIVRPGSAKLNRLPRNSRVEVIARDLYEYGDLGKEIPETCDVFYHLAWSHTGAQRENSLTEQVKNIEYSLEAIQVAAELGCKKFIGAGSQAEYGMVSDGKIAPDTPTNPILPYGIAKYAAGKFCRVAAQRFGIDCLWVRIFSIYGKYDKETTMIQSSLRKFLEGEKASFTGGEQIWDYLYCEDAGDALVRIGERAVGNKVYCLGSGKPRRLRNFIEDMRDVVDPSLPLGIGEIPYKKEETMNLCADISELVRDTGWEPSTDFSSGIRKVVDTLR